MERYENEVDIERLSNVVAEIMRETAAMTDRGEPNERSGSLDPDAFGMAVLTRQGHCQVAGACDEAFPIQSISKVFSLTLALEALGNDVWKRVGREPSGDPYNSIIDLERHKGIPRNPFINSGALVVVDMLLDGAEGDGVPEPVRERLVQLTGEPSLPLDEVVLASEARGYANRALANLAKNFGNLRHSVDRVMAVYTRQCAVRLSCRQLARAGSYLTLDRIDARDDLGAREVRRVRRISSLMLTCGQYDGSGDFAFRVGMPAKSGVSGAILAIVPNTASVAIWSPGLDENGNSLVGTRALEILSERMGWSVFGASRIHET